MAHIKGIQEVDLKSIKEQNYRKCFADAIILTKDGK